MSVTSGSPVSSSNVNSAFTSKTSTSTQSMVGVLDLNHASSGGQVSNVQQEINNIKADYVWRTVVTESIAGSGTITSSKTYLKQYVRVQGSGGAQTASTTPFGSGSVTEWTDGLEIRLVGQDDTNTLTITHNDAQYGVILNGDATLKKYYILNLQYDTTLERWIETSRNF